MGYEITIGDATHRVEARREGDGWVVTIDDREVAVNANVPEPGSIHLIRDGRSYAARVTETDVGRDVVIDGVRYEIGMIDDRRKALSALFGGSGPGGGGEVVSTSMPGKVVTILVSEGDLVEEGQGVIVVEAMKMENELRARGPGVVQSIPVAVGDAVESGAELLRIVPLPEDDS
jgi:biotin carboxyl carrier protein